MKILDKRLMIGIIENLIVRGFSIVRWDYESMPDVIHILQKRKRIRLSKKLFRVYKEGKAYRVVLVPNLYVQIRQEGAAIVVNSWHL